MYACEVCVHACMDICVIYVCNVCNVCMYVTCVFVCM